jgi:hypothetical protein
VVLTKIRLGAVVEVDEKHAKKIARMFQDFLDGLPSRIANTTVLEQSSEAEGEANGKQVSRSGAGNRKSADRL